jgi:hypothetical protein
MFSAALLLLLCNKPLCTKQTHGQMWPAAANNDKTVLLTEARAGTLEMCVTSRKRYRWEHLTINIHQAAR